MTTGRYRIRDGRIYAVVDGTEREMSTALTADGRDLEQFERAMEEARKQRASALRGRGSLTGVVSPIHETE
jgi:hypothetical protein